MVEPNKHFPLLKSNKFSKSHCIDDALRKIGKTRHQILQEIEQDKKLELQILNLFQRGLSYNKISKITNQKESEVKFIIKMDLLNLSYRKINENYGQKQIHRIPRENVGVVPIL